MAAHQGSARLEWLLRSAPNITIEHRDEVEAEICAALVRARAAWPALVVDEERFVTALGPGVRDAADVVVAIRELDTNDLYLAQACRTGSRQALDAFAVRCHPALFGSLRAMRLDDTAIDEVVQELHTKLFVGSGGEPKIVSYSGRASLPSWVRTVATRAAVDRVRHPVVAGDDAILDRMPHTSDSPELAHFRSTYHAEFKESFEAALASLELRERNVLRHYYIDALTVDDIGALYAVHKTTAFRWLDAARTALVKRTRSNFGERVKAMPAELDSILRLVQSQVDLSLSRVLA